MSGIKLVRNPEAPPELTPTPRQEFLAKLRSKTAILTLLIGLSILAATGLIYRWYFYSRSHFSTDNAFVESDLLPVNSRIMGFVKEVSVAENAAVHKGDVLLRFDDQDVQIEMSYKTARYKKAKMDYERAQNLVRSRAISPSDFELAETNYLMAKADFEGVELKHSFTEIRAVADGTIARRSVQPGQFIQPGQTLLMLVSNENPFWIKANYKETQIGKLRPGLSVDVVIDAYPDQTLQGRVEGIYPSTGSLLSLLPPENATGNFTKITQRFSVRISITQPNPPLALRTGMSAHTTIRLEK